MGFLKGRISRRMALLAGLFLFSNVVGAGFVVHRLDRMKGDGRIVNEVGIVRGASQRYVKLVLAGRSAEAVRRKVDSVLQGLVAAVTDPDLSARIDAAGGTLDRVATLGLTVKTDSRAALVEASETFFAGADGAAALAEAQAKQNVVMLLSLEALLVAVAALLGAALLWTGRQMEAPTLKAIDTMSGVVAEVLSASGVVAEVSQQGAAGVETNTAEMAEAAATLAQIASGIDGNCHGSQEAVAAAQIALAAADSA